MATRTFLFSLFLCEGKKGFCHCPLFRDDILLIMIIQNLELNLSDKEDNYVGVLVG